MRKAYIAASATGLLAALIMGTSTGAQAFASTKTTHHTNYLHKNVVIRNLPRTKGSGHGHQTKNLGWSSGNWSGYAITGGPYNDITGEWVVPSVQPTAGDSYSSSWIGIDGFNNSNLIQTGTEQDYVGGQAQYDAWWEILPDAETVIPSMAVYPGDAMSAEIQNIGGGYWQITINDLTQNETFNTTQYYNGPTTSAEWIQEAPQVNGQIAPLANYGQTTFDPGTVNGVSPGITSSDGGVIVQNGTQVSTPSDPDGDTDGFNVAYGPYAPSSPAS